MLDENPELTKLTPGMILQVDIANNGKYRFAVVMEYCREEFLNNRHTGERESETLIELYFLNGHRRGIDQYSCPFRVASNKEVAKILKHYNKYPRYEEGDVVKVTPVNSWVSEVPLNVKIETVIDGKIPLYIGKQLGETAYLYSPVEPDRIIRKVEGAELTHLLLTT